MLDQKINMINSGTLFGNYMTKGQATHFLGSKLQNTRKDAKILEGALIMMTMKEAMKGSKQKEPMSKFGLRK